MCFDLDSAPPIPAISGAAVSHDDLTLEAAETVEIIGKARTYVLVLAAVLLIPALVAGGIALAVARRRALTVALIPATT